MYLDPMNIQLQAYLSDKRMNMYKYRTDSKIIKVIAGSTSISFHQKFSKQFLFEAKPRSWIPKIFAIKKTRHNFQILTSQDFSNKIRDKAKNIIYRRTLWHCNSMFGSSHSAISAYQRFTKK